MLAEILLQRTQSLQVVPVYQELVSICPTPSSLTVTPAEVLGALLKPLGLRKRVAVLKNVADWIIGSHDGQVPNSFDSLTHLPGVGSYIANAVLCFGFNRQVPIVDSNVIRVLSRYFGLRSERARARDDPNIWRFAASILPDEKAREFNLAMLDFEAVVCKPRHPDCLNCPFNQTCKFYASPSPIIGA